MESLPLAIDNYFSSILPFTYFDSAPNKLTTISYMPDVVPGVWLKVVNVNGSITTSVAVPPSFSSCLSPSEYFQNGVEFGWQLCAVLAVAWSVMVCSRLLK